MPEHVLAKKMESLVHCLERLEKRKPATVDILMNDYDLQDILSVNLERAVQLSVDMAAVVLSEMGMKTGNTMADSFRMLEKEGLLPAGLSLRLQKSVGFRNISVHEYQSIDWSLVFDIVHNHLDNFKEYLRILAGINTP